MRYLSVCSGIEAATVAWHPLGWEPVAFAEIEAFPQAVLKHHYPDVPNWGDMTRYQEWPDVPVDVVVGGTPCQSFSVAGLRQGLADPRGNLALVFLGVVDRYRPRWVVWENVPGVRSSGEGRDFGAFLGGLAELGYGWAYRSLDAQYFGLAQRRERVFVVAHLGDWRPPAAVLFEPESLSGHPAPRRETGEGAASSTPERLAMGSLDGTGGGGHRPVYDGTGAARSLNASGTETPHLIMSHDPACTLTAREYKGALPEADLSTVVTHSLKADGFDAGEDGTGRGTPPVVAFGWQNSSSQGDSVDPHVTPALDKSKTPAVAYGETNASSHEADAVAFLSALRSRVGTEAFAEWGSRILDPLQSAEVLRAWLHGQSLRCAPYSFGCWLDDSTSPRPEGMPTRALLQLWESGPDGRTPQGRELAKQLARELGKTLPGLPYQGSSKVAVRRLTPREAERLQGFPDDYTLVPYRGKPAADGPRYKALGNSMAVPVMAWLGQRIALVDAVLSAEVRGAA